MSAAHLSIKKYMAVVHGKNRPFIEVKGHVSPEAAKFLTETFPTEPLFKRQAYANGFDDGGLAASPSLSRMLSGFVKNDACPEITVKTLIQGQKFEGTGVWDIMCFEFVAKRSFDALAELVAGIEGFGTTSTYAGCGVAMPADVTAFEADTRSEMTSGPATVAEGGVQGIASAA
jgi:hypothetical protein